MLPRHLTATGCLLLFALLGGAQAAPAPDVTPPYLGAMKWRQIGPFRGGRVVAASGVPGDAATWYFGGVGGGVWKTTDEGASWKPIFDDQKISSIGAIAVADSDHNVIYVGTGEACPRGNISYGDGVYKSTDAGHTWKNIGLRDTRQIGAVIVNPHNSDIVLVAALGHAFGPNDERGVFRTADGGRTWTKVLFKDRETGAIDLAFDPANPNIVYASLWQMRRQPWNFSSGGPGSGLYKSLDGGVTWERLEGHGLPDGILGRIGISVAGGGSGRVYALVEAQEGGLFRSDDVGRSWTRVNEDHRFRQRAWYFSHVFADPTSADVVYVLNTGAYRSADGGKTFDLMPAPHGDHHALWIDPHDPQHMINGNDGGASITLDGGKAWTAPYNQPTAQFYHVAVDNRWPYRVYGAQQDNTTIAIASRDDEGVIGRQDWFPVGGGESGFIAPDPKDSEIIYANSDSGQMTRYDHRANNFRDVSVYPLDVSGNGAAELKYRLQWTEPLFVSAHDSNVLYTAAQMVLRSSDQGGTWQPISPDLTRNDKSKQQPSGGPITLDITSVEYYDTVFALAESPRQKGLLWAGSDDGLVHLTRDDGGVWTDVTPKDMPAWSMVSLIDPSPHDAASAYMAVDRHKLDDLKPLVYRTHDFGKSWTRIVNGIPDGAYVHAVREDPQRKGLLYAGTELGVFFSVDDGSHWHPLQLNLPTTPVHDLLIKDNDLVAATHGRSFWILDDVSPVRQISDAVTSGDFHLFHPARAVRLHYPPQVERRLPVGDNPPAGAVIDYYLKAQPSHDEEMTLDILDAGGKVIRHLSDHAPADAGEQPAEWTDRETPADVIPDAAGANRFIWDLRHDDPVKIPGAFYSDEGPKGPLVTPGRYQLRLTLHGQSQVAPLDVFLDPRLEGQLSAAQLKSMDDLSMQTWADIDVLHKTVNAIRQLRSRTDLIKKWGGEQASAHPVIDAINQLDAKLKPVEARLLQVNMAASEDNLRYPNMLNEQYDTFAATLDSEDFGPTESQRQVFAYLHGQLAGELDKWRAITASDLPALQRLMHDQGQSLIVEAYPQ
jgi:photosystem II stability/assembly factor-like uncharacterized protein